jgi:hypothetical protein
MQIDGHLYTHGVARIEVEKVRGEFSQFVRLKIIDHDGDSVSFACWGVNELGSDPPIVIVTEKDERVKLPALNDDDDGE